MKLFNKKMLYIFLYIWSSDVLGGLGGECNKNPAELQFLKREFMSADEDGQKIMLKANEDNHGFILWFNVWFKNNHLNRYQRLSSEQRRAETQRLANEQRLAEQILAEAQRLANEQRLAEQILAEQILAEAQRQEKAKLEKAKQEKAEQEKAELEKAKLEKAKLEKAKLEKAEQEKAEQEKAEQEKAEQEKAEQEKAEQEKAEQEKAKIPGTPNGSEKKPEDQLVFSATLEDITNLQKYTPKFGGKNCEESTETVLPFNIGNINEQSAQKDQLNTENNGEKYDGTSANKENNADSNQNNNEESAENSTATFLQQIKEGYEDLQNCAQEVISNSQKDPQANNIDNQERQISTEEKRLTDGCNDLVLQINKKCKKLKNCIRKIEKRQLVTNTDTLKKETLNKYTEKYTEISELIKKLTELQTDQSAVSITKLPTVQSPDSITEQESLLPTPEFKCLNESADHTNNDDISSIHNQSFNILNSEHKISRFDPSEIQQKNPECQSETIFNKAPYQSAQKDQVDPKDNTTTNDNSANKKNQETDANKRYSGVKTRNKSALKEGLNEEPKKWLKSKTKSNIKSQLELSEIEAAENKKAQQAKNNTKKSNGEYRYRQQTFSSSAKRTDIPNNNESYKKKYKKRDGSQAGQSALSIATQLSFSSAGQKENAFGPNNSQPLADIDYLQIKINKENNPEIFKKATEKTSRNSESIFRQHNVNKSTTQIPNKDKELEQNGNRNSIFSNAASKSLAKLAAQSPKKNLQNNQTGRILRSQTKNNNTERIDLSHQLKNVADAQKNQTSAQQQLGNKKPRSNSYDKSDQQKKALFCSDNRAEQKDINSIQAKASFLLTGMKKNLHEILLPTTYNQANALGRNDNAVSIFRKQRKNASINSSVSSNQNTTILPLQSLSNAATNTADQTTITSSKPANHKAQKAKRNKNKKETKRQQNLVLFEHYTNAHCNSNAEVTGKITSKKIKFD